MGFLIYCESCVWRRLYVSDKGQDRTNEMFWQWFEVELHSIVMDSCMEPIEEEEL